MALLGPRPIVTIGRVGSERYSVNSIAVKSASAAPPGHGQNEGQYRSSD